MLSTWPRFGKMSFVLAAVCLATLTPGYAQRAEKPDNTRKLVRKVAPKYPPELKKHNIGGVVRLSVVISPNGSVDKVSTLGGNAALADAAVVAVKQWRYVPAVASSVADVQFDFIPTKD
jgi:TonB family protein